MYDCGEHPDLHDNPEVAFTFKALEKATSIDAHSLDLALDYLEELNFITREETCEQSEAHGAIFIHLKRKGYSFFTLVSDQRRIAVFTFVVSVVGSIATSIVINAIC